jgi:proteasome lid subunit RPN8/RPN11
VRERPPGRAQISYADREAAEVGDFMRIGSATWVVVSKEPPFEERRIERIVCRPAL